MASPEPASAEPLGLAGAPVTIKRRVLYGLLFVLCVAGFIGSQLLGAMIAGLLINAKEHLLRFNMVYRPLGLVFMLLLFGAMARWLEKDPASLLESQSLGFARRWKSDLFSGSLLGAGMVMLCVLAIILFGGYHPQLLIGPGTTGRVLAILWMGLTAAALEEVAFRGYPFKALIKSIGPAAATALLALLFGAIHLANPNPTALGFANTALVSVLLSIAYIRTGNLWLPIGIHFGWNFTLGTIFGLPVSGVGIFAVAVKASAEGPTMLTGGDYGIEASLTGAVAILVGTAFVYLFTRSKQDPGGGNQ